MTKRTTQSRLRLATNGGKRVDDSRDSAPPLHGQISKSEFAAGNRFDLPSTPLGNFLPPHADGLPADAEGVGKSLVGSALSPAGKMIENLLKTDLAHQRTSGTDSRSVSMLPRGVKRLTNRARSKAGKLSYMQKKRAPRDEWAIQRGQAMKAARHALGLSQAKVAEYAGIKDRETIAQYESGLIADIAPSAIPALAKALGLSPQQLSREPWGGKDDAADLRVSPIAKQLAYCFDDYPLALQNQIRAAIASYEALVKVHGKAHVDAIYTPVAAGPRPTETRPQKRKYG